MLQFLFRSLIIVGSLFISGCMKNDNLNISDYPIKINTKLQIPQICMYEYKYTLPRVAVLDLINNSTYEKAKVKNSHSSGAIGLGLGVTGFVAGAKESKSNVKRTIKAKLSPSITPLIETIVLNTGGATLYTRSELSRIDKELKLQESGLLDPNSIVEFGKLSGVQYLITGTIDNVTADYRGYIKHTNSIENAVRNTQSQELKLASSLLSLGASLLDGTDIQTQVTIKMIEVNSGKIIFTKSLKEEIKVSNRTRPTYDQIISGIKTSINKAMPQLEKEFSKYFKIQGYITKLRKNDDDLIAQINLGSKHKIKEGDKFKIFSLEENIDPLTGAKSCEKINLQAILNGTNQISKSHTWVKIKDIDSSKIKILQLVQKVN